MLFPVQPRCLTQARRGLAPLPAPRRWRRVLLTPLHSAQQHVHGCYPPLLLLLLVLPLSLLLARQPPGCRVTEQGPKRNGAAELGALEGCQSCWAGAVATAAAAGLHQRPLREVVLLLAVSAVSSCLLPAAGLRPRPVREVALRLAVSAVSCRLLPAAGLHPRPVEAMARRLAVSAVSCCLLPAAGALKAAWQHRAG